MPICWWENVAVLLSRLSSVQSMPSDGGMDKRDEGRRDGKDFLSHKYQQLSMGERIGWESNSWMHSSVLHLGGKALRLRLFVDVW